MRLHFPVPATVAIIGIVFELIGFRLTWLGLSAYQRVHPPRDPTSFDEALTRWFDITNFEESLLGAGPMFYYTMACFLVWFILVLMRHGRPPGPTFTSTWIGGAIGLELPMLWISLEYYNSSPDGQGGWLYLALPGGRAIGLLLGLSIGCAIGFAILARRRRIENADRQPTHV
jgi:hypothetical protein